MNLAWDNIDKDNSDKIADLIVDHVRKNHCCRVGWACKQILGNEVQENVLDKFAARVVESGEFIKETSNINFKYDWNITKNPSYHFRDRHPIWLALITAFITAAFSILVSYLISI